MLAAEIVRSKQNQRSYESCTDQKAAHPYCRGRERSTAVCGLPCPVRFEPDFELISVSLPDIGAQQNIDLVLLGNCHNLLDVMSCLKAPRPQLRIIVTGSGMDEQTILKAIAEGAKGYVDAAASPADFVQAIRTVSRGSVWVPRRVLSMFIERISNSPRRILPADQNVAFTDREAEVLKMLVEGRSNKEIGTPLGIRERTVKAHVAKLMRKVGVENRVALTVHAITHSLVPPQ